MPLFEWNTGLDIHVNAMNDEHKKLIAIMNRLFERNNANASKPELASIIQELGNYTVGHFQREEAYMASVNFPGIDTHKIIHQNLLSKFADYSKEFASGDGKVSPKFFHFLTAWLSTHIRGIDMKYGDFCQGLKKAA